MAPKHASFDWKEYTLKGIAGTLMGLAVLLLLFFVVVCFIYFPPRGMSSSLSNLGLYGDYFGGIVGGITSIATLGVTIYLALVLQRLEKDNAESAIEAQKKVAIMQFKLKEFALFNERCDLDIQTLPLKIEENDGTYSTYKSILNAVGRITTLFPELDNKGKYIEFHLLIYNLKALWECAKDLDLKMSQLQSPVVCDIIRRKMFDHFEAATKAYYDLVKKLSDWALE